MLGPELFLPRDLWNREPRTFKSMEVGDVRRRKLPRRPRTNHKTLKGAWSLPRWLGISI
jgi:hypothetical protein